MTRRFDNIFCYKKKRDFTHTQLMYVKILPYASQTIKTKITHLNESST